MENLAFGYLCVPRCQPQDGENPTSTTVCVLKLFSWQALAFYFEMDGGSLT